MRACRGALVAGGDQRRSQLSLRSVLGVCHRHTTPEPTGENRIL
ncbi:hypothetical protein [uncultured Neglectibacter sp.]